MVATENSIATNSDISHQTVSDEFHNKLKLYIWSLKKVVNLQKRIN